MIAPGHDELDHRVLRSLKAWKSAGRDVVAYFEDSRVSSDFIVDDSLKRYKPIKLSALFVFNKSKVDSELLEDIEQSGLVYIHDSGLYGTFLVRFINHFYPHLEVVLDYHDLIDFEIIHHLSKLITFSPMVKLQYNFVKPLIESLIISRLNIKAVVGISDLQVNLFLNKAGDLGVEKYSVPNTRVKIDREIVFTESTECNLVWIGNIGSNRSIEKLFLYQKELASIMPGCDVGVEFVGKVYGKFDVTDYQATFKGAYRNDEHVIDLLSSDKSIGVFFGWEDLEGTRINELASPNKVFTFLNVGLPFLIPDCLSSLIELLKVPDCFVFSSESEFVDKAVKIYEDYPLYVSKVKELKNRGVWDEDVEKDLVGFYRCL